MRCKVGRKTAPSPSSGRIIVGVRMHCIFAGRCCRKVCTYRPFRHSNQRAKVTVFLPRAATPPTTNIDNICRGLSEKKAKWQLYGEQQQLNTPLPAQRRLSLLSTHRVPPLTIPFRSRREQPRQRSTVPLTASNKYSAREASLVCTSLESQSYKKNAKKYNKKIKQRGTRV